MNKTVLKTIEDFNMVAPRDFVVAAVSGGADSVAMLHFLLSIKNKLGFELACAHFEHGIRGAASLEDAKFVEKLCSKHNIRLFIEHGNMQKLQRPKHLGEEAFARKLRYEFFEKLVKENNAKIATAHTCSDNAETVIFNAVRGSGPRGLAGIPPAREGFIRPFIRIERKQVEIYCENNKLEYVNDETNNNRKYARNIIRHDVMPLLEEVHFGAAKALARNADDMRELSDWLLEQAVNLLKISKIGNKNLCTEGYDAQQLQKAPQPVRLQAFALLCGENASREALRRVQQVLDGEINKVQLSEIYFCMLSKNRLVFDKKNADKCEENVNISFMLGRISLDNMRKIDVLCENSPFEKQINKKTVTKDYRFAADYDKINKYSVFRTRMQGDFFAPYGRGVTKTLKKWMSEQGIMPSKRNHLPILADGNKVLWVFGGGFSEEVRVDENTKKILSIKEILEVI